MKRLVLLTLALSGCSGVRVKPICPPLVDYSRVDQNKLADELSHGVGEQTNRFLSDYAAMRKADRICKNG